MATNSVRGRRKAKKLTLEGLSERTGISTTYLSRLESGKRRLNNETASQIAAALGCEVFELFQITDNLDVNNSIDDNLSPHSNVRSVAVVSVPIVNWVQAGQFSDGNIDLSGAEKTYPYASNKTGLFALEVAGDSMKQEADDGDLIVIDPGDRDLVDGKFKCLCWSKI